MASKEIYDYVAVAVADNNQTLTLKARGTAVERGVFNQIVHEGDDGSEEIIILDTTNVFYITIPYSTLNESDAGTVMDFYFNTGYGHGVSESFKFTHGDGHTYVVRFTGAFSRQVKLGNLYSANVEFKILGRIAD